MVGYLPNTLPVSRKWRYLLPGFPSWMHRETLPHFFSLYLEAQIQSKNLCFPEDFLKGLERKATRLFGPGIWRHFGLVPGEPMECQVWQRNQSGKYERLRGCFRLSTILTSFKVPYMWLKPSEASDLQKHLKPSKGVMGQLSQLNVGICAAAGILSWQSMPG